MDPKLPGPDGPEAWCVALAASVINFVMAGLGRMSGILYVAFIEIFLVDRRQASVPFSVRSSMRNLLGPVVGIIGQKYGARPVILIGGIVGVLSSAVCFYATDILWMTVLWGGFSGIGAALSTTLNQAVIGKHFHKHRATAAGIAISGGCIGSFLFPALLEYLLHTYGLGGTFLIISGIILHIIPAGLMMRTPTWLKATRKKHPIPTVSGRLQDVSPAKREKYNDEQNKNYTNQGYDNDVLENSHSENTQTVTIKKDDSFLSQDILARRSFNRKKIDTNLLWENRNVAIRLLTNDFALQVQPSEINQYKSSSNDASLKEIEGLFRKIGTDVQKNALAATNNSSSLQSGLRFKDKFVQLSDDVDKRECCNPLVSDLISNPINCLSFCLDNLFQKSRTDVIPTFAKEDLENVSVVLEELWNIYLIFLSNKENASKYSQCSRNASHVTFNEKIDKHNSNSFCSHIKTACSLYTKPMFLLICFCRAAHLLTFMPVLTTIVDFCMDKGLPEDNGKYVIAALSLGDLTGRLCFGWITDKGFVSLHRYMLFVMIIQGMSTASLSLMNSRETLMPAIVVFGLFQGSLFVRHPVLVSRYLESHEQSIAMGCLNFFSGFLGFVLPIYIGYFRDTIGSYNGMLYINGAIGAIIGLGWAFEPQLSRLSKTRCES